MQCCRPQSITFLTELITPQLQSMLHLLQHHIMTSRTQLQDFLHPILFTHRHSPATLAYQLVQVPQLTPATSRSCRLRSSACSTVVLECQELLEVHSLLPPHSPRSTVPLALPLPRAKPVHPCQALLQLDPRVMAHQATCQSHQVVRGLPALLRVSILTTRASRKLWTLSFRVDHLSTTWLAVGPLNLHHPGRHPAWARSHPCLCIPDIIDEL